MSPSLENRTIKMTGESAIDLIHKINLHPFPEIYAVFFEYFRGANKKLIAEVQKLLDSNQPISEKTIQELNSKYISNDFDKKVVEESSSRVQQIMSDVLKAIDSSADDSKSFSSDLEVFTNDIEKNQSGDLSKIVSKLVIKTKEFKNKSDVLNKKLEQSRAEVDNLKATLHDASAQMMVDALSGIANRKAFDEAISRTTIVAKSESRHLCLLMIDIDHFKSFNDTYGHLVGDQVIKIVATAMKDMIKGKDFVARYGGEEFAVLLPDTPLKGAQIVAESIRSNIASRELRRKDSHESYGQITVSIGIALFRPVHDDTDEFISRADKALYTSKKQGRNRVTTEE
jgi:diguanylate cyclase